MAITPLVNKDELLGILRENREKHRAVFEAALEGWRKDAIAHCNTIASQLKAGKRTRVHIIMPMPADHTADYDRAIRSLELHTQPTIQLDERDAAQLIQDDWGWKHEWARTSNRYAADAYTASYGTLAEDE
jgi:hypothetical protein